jgi:CRP-like cAMP-binding protein
LLSGFAKVTAAVENGETSLLALRAGGDTAGETAAMDGAPRSATVTACGPLTARVLRDGDLRSLLMRRPEVSMALTGIVADRLRGANRRRHEDSVPAYERTADIMRRLGFPALEGSALLNLSRAGRPRIVGRHDVRRTVSMGGAAQWNCGTSKSF